MLAALAVFSASSLAGGALIIRVPGNDLIDRGRLPESVEDSEDFGSIDVLSDSDW